MEKEMANTIYEHQAGIPLAPGDTDGMADEIAADEADGFEGEHVFDGAVESPPHPFWDPVNNCCYPSDKHYDEE
jgi:hypothetical protein